jgi:hypothetical protein
MVRTRKRARQDPSCVVPYLDRGFGLAGHGNIMIMPTITEFSQPIQPKASDSVSEDNSIRTLCPAEHREQGNYPEIHRRMRVAS